MTRFSDFVARRRAALRDADAQKGFTLIELMVVVIIIAILAAIAIPQFMGQRQAAWDAETKSDLSNYVIAAAAFSVKNKGLYGTSGAAMQTSDLTASPYNFGPSVDDPVGNWTLAVATDLKSYTITVFNKNFTGSPGHTFTFSSVSGQTSVS